MISLANVAAPLIRASDANGAAAPFRIEILSEFEAAEALWRGFEREAAGTPFQRYDWVAAFWKSGAQPGAPCIVTVSDAAGRTQMLLPLVLEARHGIKVARFTGGKQASYHAPLVRPGFCERLTPGEAGALLGTIGRQLGADALAFSNMPLAWCGERNPFAVAGKASPSSGWRLALAADGETSLARAFSKETRRKFRKKERKLSELGPVAHTVARTPEEADGLLAAFFSQKRARSRATGLDNPFEAASVQDFLSAACRAGLDEGRPAIELHALLAGERVAAVFGAAIDDERCCGMFISFDGDPAVARSSPGELLLIHAITAQCEAGRKTFDLGVGEATYKSLFCDEPEPLVDLTLAITAKGRLFTFAADRRLGLKRLFKQTPALWRAVTSLRKRLV